MENLVEDFLHSTKLQAHLPPLSCSLKMSVKIQQSINRQLGKLQAGIIPQNERLT